MIRHLLFPFITLMGGRAGCLILYLLFVPLEIQADGVVILLNKEHENFDITTIAVKEFLLTTNPAIPVFVLDPLTEPLPTDINLLIPMGSDMVSWAHSHSPRLPIVFGMVLNPLQSGISSTTREEESAQITGVSLEIPLQTKIDHLHRVVPKVHRIGILYSQEKEDWISQFLQPHLDELGFEVVTALANGPQDVPRLLQDLASQIDLLWMIPDAKVYNTQTVRYLIPFCIKVRLPILALSRTYTEAGALLSVSWDFQDMGIQIGELAVRVLNGEEPSKIPIEFPRVTRLLVNKRTADRIGVSSWSLSEGLEIVQR